MLFATTRYLAVIFLFISSAESQPRFDRLSTADGLSTPAVTALLQDSRGFVWVGTFDGLNRYDGVGFKAYRHDPLDPSSLSHTIVNTGALLEHAGALWIGTRNGLNRLDPATDRFEHFLVSAEAEGPGIQMVTALSPDGPDGLWVGTVAGLLHLNTMTRRIDRTPLVVGSGDDLPLLSLAVDSARTRWAGTFSGLYRRSAADTVWHRVDLVPEIPIFSLFLASDGALWVGMAGGAIARYDPNTGEWRLARQPSTRPIDPLERAVLSFTEDASGTILTGTFGDGLCEYTGRLERWTCHTNNLDESASLSDDRVTSVLVDRAGTVFAGTWSGLSRRAPLKAFQTLRYRAPAGEPSLSHPRVNAIHQDREGHLWVGFYGGGVDRIERDAGTVTPFSHDPDDESSLSHDEVWAIAEDAAGRIWIGTGGGGLNRFVSAQRGFVRFAGDIGHPSSPPDMRIYSIYLDRRQTLWIGTVTQGLARFVPEADGFVSYRPGSERSGPTHFSVWPLLEDRAGRFWVGTVGGGVNRMDRDREVFDGLPASDSLSLPINRSQVVSLAESGDGAVWIGTTGAGVGRFDPDTGDLRMYTMADSLPHVNVACILPGEGNDVWVATWGGLARIGGESGAVTATYTASDGLLATVFNDGACHRAESGELFFGTNSGLVSFFPSDIVDNPTAPRVALTGFELFGQPHDTDSSIVFRHGIRLGYRDNEVTFRFAVLDFASPAENRYAYRLEGVDADWIFTRTSFARYPRLEPGNYTFRVRGASSDGVWSRETVELRLTIEPPFWQESWFLFLSFVAVFAGIYLAAQRGARRQLRFEKLERQVQAEREESRRRFVRELHDDISGELGSVVFALERYGRKDHIPEADRKELLGYWHRLRGLFEFFRDAIWVLESKNDTLRGLIERIETTTYQFFDDGRAFFHGPESVPDVRVSMDQRQHIFLIGKEALHNALKYARATRVEVDVIYEAGVFTLSVRDDGAGFDPVRTQEGQGLRNMRERAEALQATWTLESALGAGTRVKLVVKIP